MRAVSSAEAKVRCFTTDAGSGELHYFFGEVAVVRPGPQAYLIDLQRMIHPAAPHFHDIDQFQVVVRGSGRMGKKRVRPVSVHYADAFSPYGPIVADADGLGFFTIRVNAARGHFTMPGSRHLMPGRAGRNITADFDIERGAQPPGEWRREALLGPFDDGMFAAGLRIGPDAAAPGVDADASGQVMMVCRGALIDAGRALAPFSLLYLAPGEAGPALQSGPEGADVLVLQFARGTARPGSGLRDPAEMRGDYVLPPGLRVN